MVFVHRLKEIIIFFTKFVAAFGIEMDVHGGNAITVEEFFHDLLYLVFTFDEGLCFLEEVAIFTTLLYFSFFLAALGRGLRWLNVCQ